MTLSEKKVYIISAGNSFDLDVEVHREEYGVQIVKGPNSISSEKLYISKNHIPDLIDALAEMVE